MTFVQLYILYKLYNCTFCTSSTIMLLESLYCLWFVVRFKKKLKKKPSDKKVMAVLKT